MRTVHSIYSSVSFFSALAWMPAVFMASTAWSMVLINRRMSYATKVRLALPRVGLGWMAAVTSSSV